MNTTPSLACQCIPMFMTTTITTTTTTSTAAASVTASYDFVIRLHDKGTLSLPVCTTDELDQHEETSTCPYPRQVIQAHTLTHSLTHSITPNE